MKQKKPLGLFFFLTKISIQKKINIYLFYKKIKSKF